MVSASHLKQFPMRPRPPSSSEMDHKQQMFVRRGMQEPARERRARKRPATLRLLFELFLANCLLIESSNAAHQNQLNQLNGSMATQPPDQNTLQQQQTSSISRPNYLETGRQITGILDRFMSLGYDKRVRPNYGGPPVEVNVTMRILSISSVSEVMMDFTADFYFRQTWHDPRLAFRKLGDIQTLYVGAEVSKKIWLPDTFFGNEKMAYFHEATTPNVFLRIDHSGEVYRSIRLTVTSSCPMNLQYFPMDRQRCTIEAESYGYNVKDIIYRWARKDTAVERDKEISLPQFDIVQTVQKYRLEELSSGTYSRLIAEIHFARRMGYYLIQIYIPSSLIVVISWVSFWLHRNASPARVQLGVTTVLTMTTLMSSTNAALPKISYVKSIDIFLGTCFVMVFAALLEYATVGYLGKRIAMRKAHAQHSQSQAQAKLYAQLQAAQGAQGGDQVPLVLPVSVSPITGATRSPGGGQASGNLGLFAHNTPEPPQAGAVASSLALTGAGSESGLLSAANVPLAALINAGNEANLLSAIAQDQQVAAAAAAAATRQSEQHQLAHHNHHHRCHQTLAAPGQCLCSGQANQQTASGLSPSCHREHHNHHKCCHSNNLCSAPPAGPTNCSREPQSCQCRHQHKLNCSCQRQELPTAHKHNAPQAPPRRTADTNHRNLLTNNNNNNSCQCQSRSEQKASSQTLPRSLNQFSLADTHSHNGCCADKVSPSYDNQRAWLNANLSSGASPLQVAPRKGGPAAAAAAAAATFVNLHRKNKGLPPSTNPNFAPFGSLPLGYSHQLETIFGIRPSDIDKYSRVVFPVCFVCFQLMYWIVYLHISAFLEPDQMNLQQPPTLTPAPQPMVSTQQPVT